jgi:hypothetical protein
MTDHTPDAGKNLLDAISAEILDECGHEDSEAAAFAAIRAIEAAGYRIVPVEPTEEMP